MILSLHLHLYVCVCVIGVCSKYSYMYVYVLLVYAVSILTCIYVLSVYAVSILTVTIALRGSLTLLLLACPNLKMVYVHVRRLLPNVRPYIPIHSWGFYACPLPIQ